MLSKYYSHSFTVIFGVIMLNAVQINSYNDDSQSATDAKEPKQRILSRQRRYLIFPEGSSIQLRELQLTIRHFFDALLLLMINNSYITI